MTLDALLSKASPKLQGTIREFRKEILSLGGDTQERCCKTQIAYWSHGRGLAWIQPSNRSFVLYLRGGTYDDPKGLLRPSGWNQRYQALSVYEEDADIEYLKRLLRQSFSM